MAGFLGVAGGGVIGGAAVRLVLDSSQFTAGLSKAEGELKGFSGRMQAIGSGMSRVGSALTRGVTVPLVAAGAVATKMALDFNKAFVQIQTLASSGGHSIAEMKTEVLDLAKATGQDPSGLATALYQVLSAGKAAASQAFPILESAAKGAALGMGNVNDIAHLLTSAMNAYGPKALSASQAMDILTQTTHDSAAEADALATALGPVIGVASQVGVSFAEVNAAMAIATNQGIDAARAATGLRFLLASLSAPTDAATTSLKDYGISLQDLQNMVSTQGLVGTLQTLADKFDLTSVKGQQAWKDVIGGARGAIVANTLVGKSANDATQEVQKLGDAAGVTDEKFKLWGQTITGKNAKALSDLKVAAIQLGQQLIPIFEDIVHAVSHVVRMFTDLPKSTQAAIVKLAGIAVLAGPFLQLAGAALRLGGALAGLARLGGVGKILGVGGGAASAAGTIGGISGALLGGAGLVAGLLALKAVAPGASDALHNFIDTLGGLKKSGISPGFLHDLLNFGTQHTGFDPTEVTAMGSSIKEMAAQLAHGNFAGKEFDRVIATIAADSQTAAAAGLHPMHIELEGLISGLKSGYLNSYQFAGGLKQLNIASFSNEESFHAYANALDGVHGITGKVAMQTQGLIDKIYKQGGALTQDQAFWLHLRLEQGKYGQATKGLQHILDGLGGSAENAGKGVQDAGNKAKGATKDIDGAGRAGKSTGTALKGSGKSGHDAAGGYKDAGGAANDAEGKVKGLGAQLGAVGRMHPKPTITVNTSQAVSAVHSVLGLLQSVNGYVAHAVISVSKQVTSNVPGNAAGGIIPGATGFVTRAPTYLVGEGNYSTFAGKGAEAVIPLNSRGIDILGKAMKKAGGGPTINLTINTNGGGKPEDIAQAVSRHLSRVMLQEALV